MSTTTTFRSLDARASAYVAALPASDPLAEANRLMDEAVALQDCGDFAAADDLFDRAETLLANA